MNALSQFQFQLQLCKILNGCLSSDVQCMREFVCNADRFIDEDTLNRSSSVNICLCCIISILTLKDAAKECHGDEMFAASVHKILDIVTRRIDDAACSAMKSKSLVGIRDDALLSFIAINVAIHRKVLALEALIGSFMALLSIIQSFVICFTESIVRSESSSAMFSLALVSALDIIQMSSESVVRNENISSYIGVVKDIIQFCCVESNDFFEPEVKENAMKLAICLVKFARCEKNAVSKAVLTDKFLADWSLQMLSKVHSESEGRSVMPTLFIQISLEFLDLAFSKTSTQQKRFGTHTAKLTDNVLMLGIVTKMIWLLSHPKNAVRDLSGNVLCKLTGVGDGSRRQQKNRKTAHIRVDDRSVAKILLKQSVVQVSLCVKESIHENDEKCQLLEHITGGIQQIVVNDNADIVVHEVTDVLSPEAIITSCTGLLLIASLHLRMESQQLFADVVKGLIKTVLNIMISARFEFVEVGTVFWQAIEFIARGETTEPEDTITRGINRLGSANGTMLPGFLETTVIMFKSLADDTVTPMECPSLTELRYRIPKLAQEVR